MKKKLLIIIPVCAVVLIAAGALLHSLYGGIKAEIDLSSAPVVDTAEQPFSNIFEQWEHMDLENYVRRFAQQLKNTWNGAAAVWPGVDYARTQAVIALTDGSQAWLVKADGTLYRLDFAALPTAYTETIFPTLFRSAADQINGQPTVFVMWDAEYFTDTANQVSEFAALPDNTLLFVLATHEEFHHQQDSWHITDDQEKLYEASANRPAQAMQMRLELLDNLEKAYLHPEQEQSYLAAAKWWLEQYQTTYPEEAQLAQPFDIIEGTARYFDMAMNVRSQYGMTADRTQIEQTYKDLLVKDYPLSRQDDGLIDSESYDLGGTACILLEHQAVANWQQTIVKQHISPVELLLQNIEPQQQPPSAAIAAQVQSVLNK